MPFVVGALFKRDFRLAIALVFIAGATDALDGYLARRFSWTTRLGAYLDPLADKLLLVGVYIMLAWIGAVPRWLVGLVLGRDVLILGMVAWAWMFTRIRSFPPSVWGKVSTFFQVVTALVVMGAHAYPSDVPEGAWREGLLLMTSLATVWSGVHYAWIGIVMLGKDRAG